MHKSYWIAAGLICLAVTTVPNSSALLIVSGIQSTEGQKQINSTDAGQLAPVMGSDMMKEPVQITEGPLVAKLIVTELIVTELSVNKPKRQGGLTLLLEVSNVSDNPVELHFSSGMDADLALIQAGGEQIWSWSQDMMFTQALSQTLLKPGGVENYRFEVPASVLLDCRPPCELQARFMGTTSNGTPLLPVMRLPL